METPIRSPLGESCLVLVAVAVVLVTSEAGLWFLAIPLAVVVAVGVVILLS